MKKNCFFNYLLNLDISIILIFLFFLLLCPISLRKMKVTLMPGQSEPVLTIITDYYGMQPDIIEEIITIPIERLLREVRGIEDYYSFSYLGRSKILVYLSGGEDVDKKAVLIRDRIYHISKSLPSEVREPCIYKYNTDDTPVMVLTLFPSENHNMEELFDLVNNSIKPLLMSVEGVANVEALGSPVREYLIQQKYTNLTAMRLNHDLLFEGVINKNISHPMGNIEYGELLHNVSFKNKYKDPEKIERDYFNVWGRVFKGEDLFILNKRFREEGRLSFINNREVLSLYVFKREHSNILEIDKGIKELLEEKSNLFKYIEVYNQAESFRKLLRQLLVGTLTAVTVMFLFIFFFTGNVFTTFLILTSIPLTFSGTVTALSILSKSINIMTLSGFICGFVAVVSNSVIVVQTLSHQVKKTDFQPALINTLGYSGRIITASTLSTCAVFIPIFYLGGERLFLYKDFALTVSIMILFSIPVSLFFIPSIINRTGIFSGFSVTGKKVHWSKGTGLIKRKSILKWVKYKNLLFYIEKRILKYPLITVIIFFLISGIFIYLFVNMKYQDIPPVKEENFETFFEFDPGLSISYKKEAMRSIGEKIIEMGLGGALVSTLEGTRVTFMLKRPFNEKIDLQKIKKIENNLLNWERDDGFFFLKTGGEKNVNSITVYFFSDNLKQLNSIVDQFSEIISGFPDIIQILKGYRKGSKEIELLIDSEKMEYLGINVTGVIRFLRYIFFQPVIMKHFDGGKMVDVRGEIFTEKQDKSKILQLRIMNEKGNFIPVGSFCSLRYSEGPSMVSRKNGRRCIWLDIHYKEINESKMIGLLKEHLGKIKFENDFYWEFSEEVQEREKIKLEFVFGLCLSVFVVYVVLGCILRSFALPTLIMLMIPSIFVGTYIFLIFSGYLKSVPVHLALIMLIGMSVNILIILTEEFSFIRIKLEEYYLSRKEVNKKWRKPCSTSSARGEFSRRQRIKKLLLLALKKKIGLIYSTTLPTVFGLVFIFFITSSNRFFRTFTGVLFSGLIFFLFLSILVFPSLYMLILFLRRKDLL